MCAQIGFWDGSVAQWRLAAGEGPQEDALKMELLLHFPALDGPMRGLAWAPPEVATAAGDLAHRHLFAAVGHTDKLRVWDTRHVSGDLTVCADPNTLLDRRCCRSRPCLLELQLNFDAALAHVWDSSLVQNVRSDLTHYLLSGLASQRGLTISSLLRLRSFWVMCARLPLCRNPFNPVLDAPVHSHWKMGLEWTAQPAAVFIAEDRGVLRWIDLNPFDRASRLSVNTNIMCASPQHPLHLPACMSTPMLLTKRIHHHRATGINGRVNLATSRASLVLQGCRAPHCCGKGVLHSQCSRWVDRCRGGQGTVWAVHSLPGKRRIAYTGADGEVAVVGLERDMATQPHRVLAGEPLSLCLPSPRSLPCSCDDRDADAKSLQHPI